MYYDESVLERVREANDIVDVVGTYVRLTRRGNNYVGLCPFHNEKTGSFNVNKNMQIYKCFGCGKAGNVFTFMMEYDNLSFPEAVQELASRAGVTLPEIQESEEDKRNRNLREKILEVNKEAAKYYYVMLRNKEGQKALEYLQGRALSEETMRNFGLGYAGIYSDGLYKYLKKKGFSDDVLKESGMFSFSERGVSDKFWNRVMFPIMDRNGKVIAFGGRIMGKAENAPKYLNSPETKAFSKGNNLYGLHIAKHTHRPYILLCEGYMDVIALHQAGFDNAVASLGTALTPGQARLISKYSENVIITYDSDGAGTKAAVRALPILKDAGIRAKVLNMKPYKDPDEFIKALGAEEYEKRIQDAMGGFFFEAETMRSTIDPENPAEKTKFDHELAAKLAMIEDEIERSNYIEAASKKYNISPQQLTRLVDKLGKEAYRNSIAKETMEREAERRKTAVKPSQGPLLSQQLFVSFIANSEECYKLVKGRVSGNDLSDPLCARLLDLIFNLYENEGQIVHAKMINHFEDVNEQERVALILDASLYEENIGENVRREAFADLCVRVLSDSLEILWQKAVENNDAASVLELMKRREDFPKLHKILAGK